jgi:hypothetical protein
MAAILFTASGRSLAFEPFSFYGNWNKVGGLYAFAYFDPVLNRWPILYIGKAKCLHTRMNNHERWQEAVDLGATHVLACVLGPESVREVWERELTEHYCPVLNKQNNPKCLSPKSFKDLVRR